MPPGSNPFTPNTPMLPEYFAGRIGEVMKIQSALNQTRHGNTQHILLTGERGIGKTSLAIYARYIAQTPNPVLKSDFKYATAYYTVERDQSLVDVCRGLTSKLLSSVEQGLAKACLEKLKHLKLHFSINVPGIAEIKVDPDKSVEVKARLYADFEKAIEEAWDHIKGEYNGILLIVDELHNLKTFEGAGSFFKVVSEAWAVDGYRNAMLAAIGLPNVPADISKDDPSAPRIFSYVELKRMTTQECLDILHKCIAQSGKRIDENAARKIATLSGGFPYFLHQLGYDAFDKDRDDIITEEDVHIGLRSSLVQFERMFFGEIYKSIEGKQKQKIVDALAVAYANPKTALELGKALRIQNVHQYLKPLEKDGIVDRVKSRYRLSSELLSVYVQARTSANADKSPFETVTKYPGDTMDLEPSPDPDAPQASGPVHPNDREESDDE